MIRLLKDALYCSLTHGIRPTTEDLLLDCESMTLTRTNGLKLNWSDCKVVMWESNEIVSVDLGNNFYLLNGVINHRFSSVYFDLKTNTGNIEPEKWLLERAKKVTK